jgi:hypothetical protein
VDRGVGDLEAPTVQRRDADPSLHEPRILEHPLGCHAKTATSSSEPPRKVRVVVNWMREVAAAGRQ